MILNRGILKAIFVIILEFFCFGSDFVVFFFLDFIEFFGIFERVFLFLFFCIDVKLVEDGVVKEVFLDVDFLLYVKLLIVCNICL